jgi:predicted CXXCH cytochrome family protein
MILGLLLTGCSSGTTEQGKQTPKVPTDKIPAIPHQVSKDMDCKSCHATGANGAKVTKHIDRANCTGCHKSA